jgi:hypothetical protein
LSALRALGSPKVNLLEEALENREKKLADSLARAKLAAYGDDLPYDDNPVIAAELTPCGWRGLTRRGELLDVRASNGVPEDLVIMRGGTAIARRKIERGELRIDEYTAHHDRALQYARNNRPLEALREIETTLALAPTLFARFNRAMILLALGRWHEGFAEYRQCEEEPPLVRPPVALALAAGLKPWRGEDLAGKTILLLHAHGFGDTIMSLRYVPLIKARGAEVFLQLPHELLGFGAQFAPVTTELVACDYFCPLLHLVGLLEMVEHPRPLRVELEAVTDWRELLGPGRHIGLAWTPGAQSADDFPRGIALEQLVAALPGDAKLHSMQQQGVEEAQALGVACYAFGDFTDCAAAMLAMDQIISIDTAALHLAGAIGHRNVVGLMSYWHSWRWLAPWYSNIRFCKQTSAGDWASALAQI